MANFEKQPYQQNQPYSMPPQQVVLVQGKSTFVAYLLWFLLGGWGIHKIYLNQQTQFFVYLGLSIVGYLLWFVLLGWIVHIPLAILLIIDLFTIPSRVREVNYGG